MSGNSTRLNRLNSRVRRLLDPNKFRWLPKTEEKWEKALARIDPNYETKVSKFAKLREAVVLSRKERTMVLDLIMEMGEMQMRVPEHEIWAREISAAAKILQRCFRSHMARKEAAKDLAELKRLAAIQDKSFWHDNDEDQSQHDQSLVRADESSAKTAHDAASGETLTIEEDFLDAQANSGDNDNMMCDGQSTAMPSLTTVHRLLDDFLEITRPYTTAASRRNSHKNNSADNVNNNNGQQQDIPSGKPVRPNATDAHQGRRVSLSNRLRKTFMFQFSDPGNSSDTPHHQPFSQQSLETGQANEAQKQTKRHSKRMCGSLLTVNPVRSEAIADSLHVPRSSSVIAVPDESSDGSLMEDDTGNPPPTRALVRRQTMICIDHSRETRVRASIVQAYKAAGMLPVMVNNQEEANDIKAGTYHMDEPPDPEEGAPILQILRRGTLRLKPIIYDCGDSDDDDDDDDSDNDDYMNCQPQEASNGSLDLEGTTSMLVSAAAAPRIRSSMSGTKAAFTSALETVQSSVRASISSIISERMSTRQSFHFPSFSRRRSQSQKVNDPHDDQILPETSSTVKKLVDALDPLPQFSQEYHTGDNSNEQGSGGVSQASSMLIGAADELLVPISGRGEGLDSRHQQTPTSKLRKDQTKPQGSSAAARHVKWSNYLSQGTPRKRPETLHSSTNRAGLLHPAPSDSSMKREAAMVTMDGGMLQLSPSSAQPRSRTADGDGNRTGILLPTKPMRHATNRGSSLAKHAAVRPNKTFGGQTSSPATPLFQQAGSTLLKRSAPISTARSTAAYSPHQSGRSGASHQARPKPTPPAGAPPPGFTIPARRIRFDKKTGGLVPPVRPSSTFPAIGPISDASSARSQQPSKLWPKANGLAPSARSKAW